MRPRLDSIKPKKIAVVSLLLVCTSAVTLFVYASGDHEEEAPGSTAESKKVIIRQVGDTDPDAISQEGTGSFFGTIISKDISSVHPPREGVISTWNVSVGDYVSLGDVLGYVTVTGISGEQQALLVEQQTNAFKAQLDAETANAVALESETVFGKVISNFKAITDKQKSVLIEKTNELKLLLKIYPLPLLHKKLASNRKRQYCMFIAFYY